MESFITLGKKIYNMNNPREVHRMWVFVIRCLLHRSKLIKLDEFFHKNAELASIADIYPFVYEQPTRSFFYNKSTFDERVRLMEYHMNFMLDKFRLDIVQGIYESKEYCLWEQVSENAGNLKLLLTYHPGQRKEGILSLILMLDKEKLYQVMFWFNVNSNSEPSLWIGALQGPNMDDARDVIKKVTKRCHGYRTKNLIIYMIQAMARVLDIKHIYAVTNYGYYANNHIRKDRKLKTSFSDFWKEADGIPTDDERFYELPLVETRKTMEEVPTRKRAVYRRRFALMDDIDNTIRLALKSLLK